MTPTSSTAPPIRDANEPRRHRYCSVRRQLHPGRQRRESDSDRQCGDQRHRKRPRQRHYRKCGQQYASGAGGNDTFNIVGGAAPTRSMAALARHLAVHRHGWQQHPECHLGRCGAHRRLRQHDRTSVETVLPISAPAPIPWPIRPTSSGVTVDLAPARPAASPRLRISRTSPAPTMPIAHRQRARRTPTGGAGADTLDGGAGNHSLAAPKRTPLLVAGNDSVSTAGAGADTMPAAATTIPTWSDIAGDQVDESAAGSSGVDTVGRALPIYTLGTGSRPLTTLPMRASPAPATAANVITGGNGGSFADTLNGLAGNDTLER